MSFRKLNFLMWHIHGPIEFERTFLTFQIRCDGEVSHGRRRKRREEPDGKELRKHDFIELKKEIIVTTPSKNRKSKSVERLPPADDAAFEDPNSELCGPRNLIIAIIIGFCILQIVIVFVCTFCVCHSS